VQAKCRANTSLNAVKIRGYAEINQGDEATLTKAVATVGPVSVGVQATYWQFYSAGVWRNKLICPDYSLNHAVVAVGYGTDPTYGDYWLLKNSWAADWGEDGYIRIQRGVNMCGLAEMASYPIV